MLKNSKVFYFCHLKKLVRPEMFGPYYVCHYTSGYQLKIKVVVGMMFSLSQTAPHTDTASTKFLTPFHEVALQFCRQFLSTRTTFSSLKYVLTINIFCPIL